MNNIEGKKINNSLFPFSKTQDPRLQKDSELVTVPNLAPRPHSMNNFLLFLLLKNKLSKHRQQMVKELDNFVTSN